MKKCCWCDEELEEGRMIWISSYDGKHGHQWCVEKYNKKMFEVEEWKHWNLRMEREYDRDPYQSIQSWVHHNALPEETVEQLSERYIEKYEKKKDWIKYEERKLVAKQIRSIIQYVVNK